MVYTWGATEPEIRRSKAMSPKPQQDSRSLRLNIPLLNSFRNALVLQGESQDNDQGSKQHHDHCGSHGLGPRRCILFLATMLLAAGIAGAFASGWMAGFGMNDSEAQRIVMGRSGPAQVLDRSEPGHYTAAADKSLDSDEFDDYGSADYENPNVAKEVPSQDKTAEGPSGAGSSGGSCPVAHPKMTMEEIRGGRQPYLVGGSPKDKCEDCEVDRLDVFCAGEGAGPVCPSVRKLVQVLLDGEQRDILTSTPCELWELIQGRGVWLLGDSQTLDFYKGVVCVLREFIDKDAGPPVHPIGQEGPVMKGIGRAISSRSKLSEKFHANRVSDPPPSCIYMLHGTKICYIRYNKMEEAAAQMDDLKELVAPGDVTVVNFGLHHTGDALADHLPRLLVSMKTHPSLGRNLYYRDTPPQHFDTGFGDWPGGKPPFVCSARKGVRRIRPDGTLEFTEPPHKDLPRTPPKIYAQAYRRNSMSLPVAEVLGIPALHTYNITTMLHNFHRDNGAGHECSHFCFPVPLIWAGAMIKTLRANPPSGPLKSTSKIQIG